MILSVIILPVSALEPRAMLCPYCYVSLSFVRSYETEETINTSCANTSATGFVHEHYLTYLHQIYICPDCGYNLHRETKTKELCEIAIFTLKPQDR